MSRRLILSQPLNTSMKAGDIAYWDGTEIKTIDADNWITSLGTAIGVVVIPEGLLPDGIARIASLKGVNSSGTAVTTFTTMQWGPTKTDTVVVNYNVVPTLNSSQEPNGSTTSAIWLPSDKFTKTQSKVDSKAYYYFSSTTGSATKGPSPYLDDNLNPDYCVTINGNNALGDFNGLSNTELLVGLGTKYTAANAAYKYKDDINAMQWYLPAAGELGFLIARLKIILNSLSKFSYISDELSFWSSSEQSNNSVWAGNCAQGRMSAVFKNGNNVVIPFAMLPLSNSSSPDSPSSGLITFTIDDVEYQAEQGMTWAVWCESSYNTDGYVYGEGDAEYVIYTNSYARYVDLNWGDPAEIKIESTSYSTRTVNWPM